MRRTALALTAGLASLALLVTGARLPAQYGDFIAPAPIPMRVVQADAIVVGKLGKVVEKNVSATPFSGAKVKVDYQVMELEVGESLRGARRGEVIRFGFMLPKANRDGPDPLRGFPRREIYTNGQECLFFLSRHHDGSFYVAPMDYLWLPIDKREDSYAKDLEFTRRCVKLWEDPLAGLEAKDAVDRLLSAGMLITRYRHYQPGKVGPETEAIPANESKLILNILADADWPTKVAPGSSLPLEMTPGWLFSQLDVTFKDGWTSPEGDYAVLYAAARQWVKAHANTYRIQRFVPVTAEKSGTKDKKD
jgi:hypothetical protein